MPILRLLNFVKEKIDHAPHPIKAGTSSMRECYLTGLAMQAFSDGTIVEEERRHFLEMAGLFDVPKSEALAYLEKAQKPREELVQDIRCCLINSKYKYYFILDLQIMAHQDRLVKDVETEVLKLFCTILDIDDQDRDFLIHLADAVASDDDEAKAIWSEAFFKYKEKTEISPGDLSHYVD